MQDFKIPIKFSILLILVILSAPTIHAQSSGIGNEETLIHAISQSYSRPESTVYVDNNKIELTINSEYPIPITLDGVTQGSDVSVFELDPGQHTFSVPETIQRGAGSRLK